MRYVRVYGHERSGNNLLMMLIGKNFYPGLDLATRPRRMDGMTYTLESGDRVKFNPYGRLFGSHKMFRPVDLKNSIYIRRDVTDTLRSYQAFLRSRGYPPPKAERVRKNIIDHHTFFEGMLYTVDYEDLVSAPVEVLRGIQLRFHLVREPPWKLVETKIGWNPRGD